MNKQEKRAYYREYYHKNRERIRSQQRAYEERNREKILVKNREKMRKAYAANPQKIKDRVKAFRLREPLYKIYDAMLWRCDNPNCKAYKDYGGRGITVCNEWRDSWKAFKEWAVTSNWQKGLHIDRIDVNGNYSPENCRFVTRLESARNKRKTGAVA
jgi:hypothetical protein